ncbi:sialate O-acetylesterase [Rhodopirellula sp. JC639]|uniref:sialate O-acetylesterase n=1 Tax=Stieleria mannarensis TaxID=2755585 RepID=UPI001603DF83|nr:sialate O-acetylesterase [Rhodopirellula sp. JC639]
MKILAATKYIVIPLIYLVACLQACSIARAEVRLPGFIGDHMVLQQQMPIRLWGWADAGETVEVSLGGNKTTATPGETGRWQVELPAMQASDSPLALVVKGNNTIQVDDVLVGEVWLCSGQSNMEWSVAASANAKAEIAAADYPLIRHIKIPRNPSTTPLDDVSAPWNVCSPETAGSFTACGYYMARRLHQDLGVPIGLINSSWGGTRVEPWTPPVGFRSVDALDGIYKSVVQRTPGSESYQATLEKHIAATRQWLDGASEALQSKTAAEPSPAFPKDLLPFQSHQDPTMLYNGMIHALVGYPIRGAIWYQGESNHAEGMLYFEKKKALIGGWRTLWNQGDFPFYYVQIAPFQYGSEDPTILPRFWEAQAAVEQLPNSGMVVINDIATLNNIHPPNKQDVGNRLALLALKNDYGKEDLVAHSPEMESMEILDGRLKITFAKTGGGLKTRDANPPSHFEVIGAGSGGYQPADATIEGDAVILTSDAVEKPVAFRFAWDKLAEPNLTGGTGLPVGAFRGGEEPDFLSSLPIHRDYQLVYDIDLGKLNQRVQYDVDHSDDVSAFDRIGYLLELRSSSGQDQAVFVSMKAFTDDATKIGIPTVSSAAVFQQSVEDMDVFSSTDRVTQGRAIATGNIEFWPGNYGPANQAGVQNASGSQFDFGDEPSPPTAGYGSMQVHNFGKRQTVFAINHWKAAAAADIGIGNSSSGNPDWTFTANAGSYAKKRLRIYVRPSR